MPSRAATCQQRVPRLPASSVICRMANHEKSHLALGEFLLGAVGRSWPPWPLEGTKGKGLGGLGTRVWNPISFQRGPWGRLLLEFPRKELGVKRPQLGPIFLLGICPGLKGRLGGTHLWPPVLGEFQGKFPFGGQGKGETVWTKELDFGPFLGFPKPWFQLRGKKRLMGPRLKGQGFGGQNWGLELPQFLFGRKGARTRFFHWGL